MTEPEVIGRYVLHVREIDADDPKEYGGKAVGLARKFGATDGHKYVNGVLDRLARELRSLEVSAQAR